MMDEKATGAEWFALQARTGHESAISAQLSSKQFEVYLPAVRRRSKWRDRTKEIHTPLFPGYIFSRFVTQHKLEVLKTPGIYSILGIGKAPVPIPDAEIEAIRRVVNSPFPVQKCAYLRVGQLVRIESGALEGLEGLLTEVKNSVRVVVSVHLMQRSIAVEVSPEMLGNVKRPAHFQGAPTGPAAYAVRGS